MSLSPSTGLFLVGLGPVLLSGWRISGLLQVNVEMTDLCCSSSNRCSCNAAYCPIPSLLDIYNPVISSVIMLLLIYCTTTMNKETFRTNYFINKKWNCSSSGIFHINRCYAINVFVLCRFIGMTSVWQEIAVLQWCCNLIINWFWNNLSIPQYELIKV